MATKWTAETWRALPEEQQQRLSESMSDAEVREISTLLKAAPRTTAAGAGFTGALQGATFNTSEEIGGAFRALVPGGEGYQEYVDRQRALQAEQQAEHPYAYGAGELAGAIGSTFVPGVGWVAGPARAAKVASTASRLGSTVARGAITGTAETAAAAAGKAEGDLFDRAATVASDPTTLAVGAISGSAGETVLGPAISWATRNLGASTARSVERNLRAIQEETGLSVDEIIERIAPRDGSPGEVLAGMTESTRVVARAIKDKSPTAGRAMTEATRARTGARQSEAFNLTETALTGQPPTPSLHRSAAEQLERQRREAGLTFGTARDTATVSDPDLLVEAIGTAVSREPGVARQLNDFYRRAGLPPLFDDAGGLLRAPTIADAEHLTRSLSETAENLASSVNSSASKQSAQALRDVANDLRAAVDRQAGPVGPGQLVGPRQAAHGAIEAEATGFPLGLDKSLGTAPGTFNEGYRVLTPEGQAATRLGAATAIRAEAPRGATANTLIDKMMETNLADAAGEPVERWAGQNIRTMIGDEAKDALGPTLERAKREQVLLDRLQGGPNTAERLTAQEALATRHAGTGNVFDALEMATQGGAVSGATKGLRNVLGSAQELDDSQLQELAGYLMETNPDLMRAALSGDTAAMNTLRDITNNLLGKVGRRQAVVAGSMAGTSLLDAMSGPQ